MPCLFLPPLTLCITLEGGDVFHLSIHLSLSFSPHPLFLLFLSLKDSVLEKLQQMSMLSDNLLQETNTAWHQNQILAPKYLLSQFLLTLIVQSHLGTWDIVFVLSLFKPYISVHICGLIEYLLIFEVNVWL